MTRIWLALAALVLGGCASVAHTSHGLPRHSLPDSHYGPVAESEAECSAVGGAWESRETAVRQRCSVPTPDAGKACKDHSGCAGLCIAPSDAKAGLPVEGVCHHTYNLGFTCLAGVSNGVAESTLCVD
jgi:hypothetical protein